VLCADIGFEEIRKPLHGLQSHTTFCLEYMERYANQFGKIGRWLNSFSLYDTTFHWARGLSMGLPDYMSRAPIEGKIMSEDSR
jgi:hypothetical protein